MYDNILLTGRKGEISLNDLSPANLVVIPGPGQGGGTLLRALLWSHLAIFSLSALGRKGGGEFVAPSLYRWRADPTYEEWGKITCGKYCVEVKELGNIAYGFAANNNTAWFAYYDYSEFSMYVFPAPVDSKAYFMFFGQRDSWGSAQNSGPLSVEEIVRLSKTSPRPTIVFTSSPVEVDKIISVCQEMEQNGCQVLWLTYARNIGPWGRERVVERGIKIVDIG